MKAKTKSKVWALLGTAVMLLPLALGLGNVKSVSAAEGKDADADAPVTITLHKLQYDNAGAYLHDYKQNTGKEKTDAEFTQGTALNGVEFTVYDVTETYWENYNASDGEKAAQNAADGIAKSTDYSNYPAAKDKDGKDVKSVTTTGNGEAVFENLAAKTEVEDKDKEQNAVYLFVETPKAGVTASQNLVVALPVYTDDQGNINTDIHLYPKNIISNGEVTIKKFGTNNGSALLDGAEFQLRLDESTDQNGTSDEGKYYQKDFDPANGLASFGEQGTAETFTTVDGIVNISGLRDGKYSLIETVAPAGFENNEVYSDSFKLGDTYSFEIKNGSLVVGKEGVNGLVFDVEDNPTWKLGNPTSYKKTTPDAEDGTISVENQQNLGVFTFNKVDVNTGAKLDGAEFNITKESNKEDDVLYVNTKAEGYKYAWSVTDAEAIKDGSYVPVFLKSEDGVIKAYADENGEEINFDNKVNSIDGLKLGEYFLHETKAPEGYALPKAENAYFSFTVNDTDDTDTKDIDNQPKGILPHTGGMGIIAFVAVGAALIAGVGFYFVKRRQETEA